LVGLSRHSPTRYLSALLLVALFLLPTGCGTASQPSPQISVLSIQSSAGFGPTAIVHSAQIDLKIQDAKQ
jgi:hypothetical protein